MLELRRIGGKFGRLHGIDVGASFYQVRDAILGGGSAHGRVMCERLASAWVACEDRIRTTRTFPTDRLTMKRRARL
jgi:hypothetical protein